MSEIILIGLGVSGLACAMELHRHGMTFSAFEKELVPAGLTMGAIDGVQKSLTRRKICRKLTLTGENVHQ